tara:strand:- start:14 stop:214 length:201 start_codon:yes stop_codon:yes gene_type:complete
MDAIKKTFRWIADKPAIVGVYLIVDYLGIVPPAFSLGDKARDMVDRVVGGRRLKAQVDDSSTANGG